jgi:hypothetical protein
MLTSRLAHSSNLKMEAICRLSMDYMALRSIQDRTLPILRWFQSSKLLLRAFTQPSRFQFIKSNPLCCKRHQIILPGLCTSTIIQNIKIPRPLFQATASNHHNVFTSILTPSEGRMSEAWEPSNWMEMSSPKTKCLSGYSKISPLYSAFYYCFSTPPLSYRAI